MRALPDSSPSFKNGFALGLIYAQIYDGMAEISCDVHLSNMDALSIMAAGNGYDLRYAESRAGGEDYFRAVFTKKANHS